MSKDKIASLMKYVEGMNYRMSNIPARRRTSPAAEAAYIEWVKREIAMASKKIEELKMWLPTK